MTITAYKFSPNAEGEAPTMENPEQFLKEKYQDKFSFGIDNISRYGVFHLLG